jgi:PAS domain-containing protein
VRRQGLLDSGCSRDRIGSAREDGEAAVALPTRPYDHPAALPDEGVTGEVREIQTAMRDISARRQAEERERQSDARYRRIVETALEGIFELDATDHVVFGNQRFAELTGYAVDEVVGMAAADLLAPGEENNSGAGSYAAPRANRRRIVRYAAGQVLLSAMYGYAAA